MSEQTDQLRTVAQQQEQLPTLGFNAPRGDLPVSIGRYRIEKLLGEGGFGRVYLAYDEQLQRLVALKVPHRHRVGTSEEAEAYLTEARTVANLDHPHIAPVYDVGSCEEFPCFIVSKYIEGTDLAAKIKQSRFSVREASELVAAIAEALHYAHKQGLVHRDVKPGNILLDKNNSPFVVDFGLALREQDVGTGPHYAGTPAYMSPEQARGEGHRVDGRSDIFSIGVVFYSLLTGRRPFHADAQEELLNQITSMEARPPRQWDEAISKEVERICLKALSKRASERYSTAKDMADDLRHYLAEVSIEEKSHAPRQGATEAATAAFVPTPGLYSSDTQRIAIVPKGLRSFDAADVAFFLELLPGPRDRNGLPDSIRFWKDRIETTGPDNTFAVGLLYGPSGCGKSSLVKAGLLPKLAKSVTVAYVEAIAEETEARLLKSLRRQLPELPDQLNLIESLAALRRGRFLEPGQKVLLVLDQLEQWLHARRNEPNAELVQALRHCDGARLQCLVLVRDDFWLAVSRFMKALEVEILEGLNSALVDLFDPIHARKVLTAFGRAYGRLPDKSGDFTAEQNAFLNQAVASLAQEGKVISVRLALLAEMVKGKPWTPATLKEVGGTEGVGVAFLEETFTASTSPPQHRLHQKAAQLVLKALLPEARANIKGHMRSHQDLMDTSGYAARPRDFADLIRILDRELRLITPTDPEGKDEDSSSSLTAGAQYYQLTHDYLVPSLRDWLTRKQRETRRGRAEQQLAERVSLWQAKTESRQLPSLLEWLEIRLLTASRRWTGPERQMMRAASRKHLATAFWTLAMLGLLMWLGLLIQGWQTKDRAAGRAEEIVRRLLDAKIAETPAIIDALHEYRPWTNAALEKIAGDPAVRADHRLRAQLALLPVDPRRANPLREEMLDADCQDCLIVRDALAAHAAELSEDLWDQLESSDGNPRRRFRAAAALAVYDPLDPRWKKSARWVADRLLKQPSLELPRWVDALRPIQDWLIPELAARFRAGPTPVAADVLGEYAADRPEILADALAHAAPDSFTVLFPRLARDPDGTVSALTAALDQFSQDVGDPPNAAASRRANLAIALLRLGNGERLWPMLKLSPDPRCRSFVIDRLAALGCEPAVLLTRLGTEADDTVRAALLLSLGGFDEQALPPPRRAELTRRIAELHRTDASAAVHAASEWLLGRWKCRSKDRPVNAGEEDRRRGWYVNGAGITMIRMAGPATFLMGAAAKEPGAAATEKQHRATIDRSYDIGMTEVTVAQYLRFLRDGAKLAGAARYLQQAKMSLDAPITRVTWYDAAAYCNWLSRLEDIPSDQWCYEPNAEGQLADGMRIAEGWQSRRGYRLPTEAEWEYACRGGSAASRCFGDAEELLPKYAWYAANATGNPMPVAQLLPNAFGMFDMHGNAIEWCQDVVRLYSDRKEDRKGAEMVWSKDYRVNRGGHVLSNGRAIRSAKRFGDRPTLIDAGGFRLARSRP
ncbi:MAG TPA: SUMF1/EgtB/PvdO family nonheme iron enzyme [Gemmataceae bacterium]|nr:SUMF1/EgtB/PvdO family nonheme iron enzyme [Gemmataceae bacterium]